MFGKNLKYYRLRSNMSKKDLAASIGVTPMAITNYENGARTPDIGIIRKMSTVLNVKLADFVAVRNDKHAYAHCEFRKNNSLSKREEEFICESVEEYFDRFYIVVEALGGEVLPDYPELHAVDGTEGVEQTAKALRAHLGFSENGPVNDLLGALENHGILVCLCNVDNHRFSGMNGTVDGRPYIIINTSMSPERQRSTMVHELAHIFCHFPDSMDEKSIENLATAISGAFLIPMEDMYRELGLKRTRITADMAMVAKEYGVSMMMLSKRAQLIGIITDHVYQDFMARVSMHNWRTNEPSRIPAEDSKLFKQLTIRAIAENDISIQRGAELLQISYEEMNDNIQLQEA